MVSISQDQFLFKILSGNVSVLSILTALSDWPWVGLLQEQSSLHDPGPWKPATRTLCGAACKALASKTFLLKYSTTSFSFFPSGKTCYLLQLLPGKWKHSSGCEHLRAPRDVSGPAQPHLGPSPWVQEPQFSSAWGFETLLHRLQGPLIPNSSPSSPDLPCHHGPLFLKTFITEKWMLLLENWRLQEPNCTSGIVNFVSEQKEKLIKDAKSIWAKSIWSSSFFSL